MKSKIATMLTLGVLSSCSPTTNTVVERKKSPQQSTVDDLKSQVLALQGTLAQINSFIASDFSTCNNSLPAFEKKICQIAQTATAEQQVMFAGQLQQVTKVFQTQIYGTDCINDTDPGCPATGSILADINAVETSLATTNSSVSTLQAAVTALQTSVGTLQTDMTALQSRLSNFNGTGSSVETVITSIQSTVSSLNSRVSAIESLISSGEIYRTVFICYNIASSGPIYEPLLIRGDNVEVRGYLASSTSNGMGVLSRAGTTGNLYYQTNANTRTCKFKVYDRTTTIKVCWKNTDKSATEAAIDTACDSANNFTTPLSSCTCAN